MKCPACDVRLIKSERLGTAVLLCPECSGEWIPPALMRRLTGAPAAAGERDQRDAPTPPPAQARPGRREELFDWF